MARSSYLNWEFIPRSDGLSTSFADLSFAEGASRRAYRAMRWKPASKWGQKAVVKEYKSSYAWAQGDWDTAVSIYKKTEELAKKFSEESGTTHPIHIVYHTVEQVVEQPDPSATLELNEWVMVEDYLEGEFVKFTSNSGYVNPKCLTTYISMPAFSHWSWVHTRGRLMVADLQGVRYSDKYVLTDPVILSLDREYGATDLALVGMVLFFMTHQCTGMCQSLHITHKRPALQLIEARIMQELREFNIQIPTSYMKPEYYDKLSPKCKQTIRAIMLQVQW